MTSESCTDGRRTYRNLRNWKLFRSKSDSGWMRQLTQRQPNSAMDWTIRDLAPFSTDLVRDHEGRGWVDHLVEEGAPVARYADSRRPVLGLPFRLKDSCNSARFEIIVLDRWP